MDVLIENGDNAADCRGENIMIDGFEETVQQALIRMKIPKGKFIYDRALGSHCGSLDISGCKSREKCLEMLINESLVNLNDIYAQVNSVTELSEGFKAEITIFSGGKSAVREVVF